MKKITYCYRHCDENHVFTTKDISGLLVSNPDLEKAYSMIPGNPVMPFAAFNAIVRGPLTVWAATGIVFEIE